MERFDFKSLIQPTWEVELPDGTVLHIKQPTQGRYTRIQTAEQEMHTLTGKEQMHKVYDLVAELMSENEEGITLTGKDLNLKHHLAEWQLTKFVNQYLVFAQEIMSAKN